MNVITDVVQLVLHYSKHIGGVLGILRTELPSEVPVKLPDAVIQYAYRGCNNTPDRVSERVVYFIVFVRQSCLPLAC
jgi:hypothetical protein